jgi:hypothetical protein
LWIVALLDGCVKRVHVDVDDFTNAHVEDSLTVSYLRTQFCRRTSGAKPMFCTPIWHG